MERSRRGTGFDYWLGEATHIPFQRMAKLEVSGIRHGTLNNTIARVAVKRRQVAGATGIEPVYIVVVEFSSPIAYVEVV